MDKRSASTEQHARVELVDSLRLSVLLLPPVAEPAPDLGVSDFSLHANRQCANARVFALAEHGRVLKEAFGHGRCIVAPEQLIAELERGYAEYAAGNGFFGIGAQLLLDRGRGDCVLNVGDASLNQRRCRGARRPWG